MTIPTLGIRHNGETDQPRQVVRQIQEPQVTAVTCATSRETLQSPTRPPKKTSDPRTRPAPTPPRSRPHRLRESRRRPLAVATGDAVPVRPTRPPMTLSSAA
ncbi:hypothetical protein KPATCC21470_1018 [Kitasatospora purpeofusca]